MHQRGPQEDPTWELGAQEKEGLVPSEEVWWYPSGKGGPKEYDQAPYFHQNKAFGVQIDRLFAIRGGGGVAVVLTSVAFCLEAL